MGKKAVCNLCLNVNDVPELYYCPTNEFGVRSDREARPELSLGAYTFAAPVPYDPNVNQKNYLVFALDTT